MLRTKSIKSSSSFLSSLTKIISNKFHYTNLDQRGFTQVEYIWIGGTGIDIRSKVKVVEGVVEDISQCSEWNYDGSSTGQAVTENSEVLMRPVALFNDPIRGGQNKMVFCDTYHTDGTPTLSNFRHFAKKILDKGQKEFDPKFGMEQEYVIMKPLGSGLSWPLGFPEGNYPKPQFQYYCGNGASNAIGRQISEDHTKLCLNAGVEIFGTNAEVLPGQWEFQIGTSDGIVIADHVWMARFLLQRVAERYGADISFDAKPIKGDWNGSGCHTNYCTSQTRAEGGMKVILEHMKKLDKNHKMSIGLYGSDNFQRLTGKHETSSMEKFSYAIANRGSSIRVPRSTEKKGKGYYEDRRPSGSADPYVIAASLFSITCLDNYLLNELHTHFIQLENAKKLL